MLVILRDQGVDSPYLFSSLCVLSLMVSIQIFQEW